MNEPDQGELELLKTYANRCNTLLSSLAVEGLSKEPFLSDLQEPILYVVKGDGKRIRPALVFAAAEAVGLKSSDPRQSALNYIACAIELIHTYSLIHDDLPAMDNDDLRRGRATLHKVYDDATAILVGDGLHARAFDLIANTPEISSDQCLKILQFVSHAIGLNGMVAGQFLDIQSTGKKLSIKQLESMHSLKTGALLTASAVTGGLAASASKEELACLKTFGTHIGLAFQITDDILDAEGTSKTLGKTPGKDAEAEKSTYVNLLGISEAKRIASNSFDQALLSLTSFGSSAKSLREIAEVVIHRSN